MWKATGLYLSALLIAAKILFSFYCRILMAKKRHCQEFPFMPFVSDVVCIPVENGWTHLAFDIPLRPRFYG